MMSSGFPGDKGVRATMIMRCRTPVKTGILIFRGKGDRAAMIMTGRAPVKAGVPCCRGKGVQAARALAKVLPWGSRTLSGTVISMAMGRWSEKG